jgi:hypothetical protein
MLASSLPKEPLKWAVAILLGVMLLGGMGVVYWVPVHGYSVSCEKARQISCAIEQETSSGLHRWDVQLGTKVLAAFRVEPRRRGSPRVLLYLDSSTQTIFAAEFEGGAAVANAQAAAVQLNQVFLSSNPASVRVEARPPSYLRWLAWGGLGFFSLLVFIIYRELFKPERRPNNSSKPTPLRGGA